MSNTHQKAAILDFDGTIVNGFNAWLNMYTRFEIKNNITLSQQQKNVIYVGSVRAVAQKYLELFESLKDSYTEDSLTQHFVDDSLEETLISPLITGVDSFLLGLKKQGIPVAIASSSTVSTIDRYLSKHNLRECVQVIVTGDDVPHCKPAPDIYIEAAHRLGQKDLSLCTVFEDSESALANAQAVGFHTVLVCSKPHYNNKDQFHLAITTYSDPCLKDLFQ